jgi:2-methylcitrate dehydratase PrpD
VYVTQRLARWAVQSRGAPLSAPVLHHAIRAVIDWHASVYPGFETEPVRLLIATLAEDLDRGDARLATGRRATTRAAAFINAAAAHAAEVDDSFREAMYHPGAATIAASFAAAQACGLAGSQFLRAVVVGYELSTRIGMVMGRAHYKYWHNTGTVGTFGAAAAAAEVMQLDQAAFAHALATAGTFAAGLQQAFRMDSMSKPLHPGRAAEAGVLAAQYASRGATGSLDILEGEAGFGTAFGDGPDWSRIDATLGQDFHIARLTFKNHIGCGLAFPAIDGALALQRRENIAPGDIQHVRVSTYKAALDIACYGQPASANEARFSIPYMVASALVHGSVRMAAYEPARLQDPATLALLQRVEAVVDPEIDALFPGQRAARVAITLRDGQQLVHFQPNRKGDPEEPLDDAELEGKLLELASPIIGEAAARELLRQIRGLDARPDVLLGPCARPAEPSRP